jgi:phosphoesterase RecJ-like protein
MEKAKKKKPMEPKTNYKAKKRAPRSLLLETARMLETAPSWILFSHQKLDGDAIGAATALVEAGLFMGKSVRWIGPDPVPPSYFFLPNIEKYAAQKEFRFEGKDDLFVVLDSANEDRGVQGLRSRSSDAAVLNIDHHEDNSRFGALNCVDPTCSSTSELVWHIMKAAGWPITPKIAECLYTGLIADTGGFMFSNTSERTHRVAANLLSQGVSPSSIDTHMRHNRSLAGMHLWGIALKRMTCWGDEAQFALSWLAKKDFEQTGAIEADTEMLVNQLLLVKGVRFAALLTEAEDRVKVSLRSKEGMVTAASVARSIGGGGHPRASGARLPLPLEKAIDTFRSIVESAYAEWASAGR